MSTDGPGADESGTPLTRAQLRALRENAPRRGSLAQEPGTAAQHPVPPVPLPTTPVEIPAAPADLAPRTPAPEAPAAEPVARKAATPAAAAASHPYTPGADTPDVGPIRGERPASGVSAPDSHPAGEPARTPRRPRDRRFTVTLLSVL
ncbi:MAG TPA: hypothetical protein VLZ82_02430, partial [Microbacterium sp.]|nr:hypothetical protein [Microbacterium sp.]